MKLAAIAKLIKADGYCKLYKVFYDDCRTYDLYIGTKTAIFPLTGFPKAQNESELATLLGISKKEWADIEFDNDCPDDLHHIEGMDLDDTADGEMDCVTGRIGIRYCGCELVPMIEPVSGTVGLWMKKTVITWSDGYSTLNNRLSHGEINSYLYELIGGTHRQFFEIYCQAYRFLIIFGIILFCLQQLGAQKFSVLYFTMLVTLAGGIAFYMIWEAKDIYSAAFLLPMFILAQEGLGQMVEKEIPVPALSAKRRFINNILIAMIAVVFLCGDYMCRTKATFNYYRINTMYNSRESDPIEMTGSLCQDFYVEKLFEMLAWTDNND